MENETKQESFDKSKPPYEKLYTIYIEEPPEHWREGKAIAHPSLPEAFARIWQHRLVEKMTVLRSQSMMKNGDQFVHVSVARTDRLPSWEELNKVKREFIGDSYSAYQILSKKEDHVNMHEHCLHLWHPIGEVKELANLQSLVLEKAL